MFSVHFHPVRRIRRIHPVRCVRPFHCVRRRKNFSLSRQSRLSETFDIWHKEYMALGKCTGWPVRNPDPRSWLWHRLAKNSCLRDKVAIFNRITTKRGSFVYLVIVITWLDFRKTLLITFILANFLQKFRMCFSRSNTILAISQEWLVRLMWNEKEVHWLDTGYNMWPWTLTSLVTLNLDVLMSISKQFYLRNWWSDWCEMELKRKWVNMILSRLYYLALWPHPWPWPWSFKVRIWNSFIQEWGSRLTMNENDVSHPFMTMILTCVTIRI